MSRLSFREQGYYEDHVSGGEPHSPPTRARDDSDQSDTDVPRSSYELFGLNPIVSAASGGSARTVSTPRSNNKSPASDMPTEAASSTGDDGVGDGSEVKSSKKKKRKKKRKLEDASGSSAEPTAETAQAPAQTTTPTDPSTPSLSKALAKFITAKRNLQEIPEPPEIEAPNDTFLRLFQETFVPPSTVSAGAVEASDEDSVAESDTDSPQRREKEKLKRNTSTASFATSTGDDERAPISAPIAGADTFALQLFNLPYRITAEQLQAFGAKKGFRFDNVVLGVDRKTQLPSGSATVYVRTSAPLAAPTGGLTEEGTLYGDPQNEEVTECIQALQGEELGGRPVRVQRFIAKRRQSGSLGGRESGRYFFEDISCKCHNCGQVGHRQVDCTNETAPMPCHLCAGLDHDAGSCPNITCYRCGKFGHHSRDCRGASMARPVICTNCGSLRHDVRACRESWQQGATSADSRVAGPMVRCMSCNKFGHVMCQPLPEIPADTAEHVYCPNCGENGHHIDFPQLCFAVSPVQKVGESGRKRQKRVAEPMQCMEPKHEAFVKFPQLLSQIDSIPLSERLEFYQQFARRCSHTEQLLFPPLARQLASISASAASSAYNNNNGSAGRARHSFGGGGVLDNGRSVRYQDGVQRMSQQSRQRQQDDYDDYRNSDDDFEELMDFASRQVGRDRSQQQRSGQKRARNDREDYYQAPPSPPRPANNAHRRHSFPLTNNNHRGGGGSYNSTGDQQYRGGNQRSGGGGGGTSSGQWGQASAAPRQPSVSDPAWQQRMDSRKRRFHD